VLVEKNITSEVEKKSQLFKSQLIHPKIKSFRSEGLMIALEFENSNINFSLIKKLLMVGEDTSHGHSDKSNNQGLLVDWFLFADNCLRIAPPLIISQEEITFACEMIVEGLTESKAFN
ncbi:MAG: aminotransferase class III-fold pyridoxal phosphate-dependent enzyme, partial [Fimbriimonadaceae bacterium]|nr:aminotransferase class III-fold pyridoxal phosphate-dependent enzyme [Chitinophagales bacterium]